MLTTQHFRPQFTAFKPSKVQNVHSAWSRGSSHFSLCDLWTLKIKGSIHRENACPVRRTGVWVPLLRSLCWFENSLRWAQVKTQGEGKD